PQTLVMRPALTELPSDSIQVVHARLEALVDDADHQLAYDVFTSRATMNIGPTLALASRFVKPGGVAFLWKGSRHEEEMSRDENWRKFWDLDGLLGVGGGRVVVAKFNRKE